MNRVTGYRRSTKASKRAAVWLAAIGVGCITAFAGAHGSEPAAGDHAGMVGKAAPDFALTNLTGRTLRLSQFKGKIVLLDFWATWCAPCQKEIPDFIQLQRRYASKGFTVLGIALDDEGAAVVKPVAKRLGINYPLVTGNTRIAAAYGGIQALPTAFLIGRDGRILKTFIGGRDQSEWEQTIQSVVARAAHRRD